jgi:hypothetical protein
MGSKKKKTNQCLLLNFRESKVQNPKFNTVPFSLLSLHIRTNLEVHDNSESFMIYLFNHMI